MRSVEAGAVLEERQTVAGAYAKIDAHEEICALRYKGIADALDDLKSWLRWIVSGVATIAVGLLGWALIQLYTLQPLRTQVTTTTLSTTTATTPAATMAPIIAKRSP